MRQALLPWSVTLWLVTGTAAAHATSMRCGIHTLDDTSRRGTSKYEVLKKCGEPNHRQGDTWVYKVGVKKRYLVRFDGRGEISSIVETH